MSDRATLASIRDAYAQVVAAKRDQVAQGATVELGTLASSALEQAARQAVLDPQDPALAELVQLSGRATAALFTLARTRGGPVELPLGRLEGPVDPATTHAAALVTGIWAAAAVRDLPSLVLLAITPLDVVRRSPTRVDPHVEALAVTLKAWWTRDPALGDRLVAALEAADPARARFAGADEVLDLRVPELDVLVRIGSRDAEGFAAALTRAIEAHREYWAARDPEAPAALFALSLVGLAAIGRDMGLGMPVPLPLADREAPRAVICCPHCVTPLTGEPVTCPACLEDVRTDAQLELSPQAWLALDRRPCPDCDAFVPAIASRCPRCRTPGR